jgi:4-diphosphocytidyl-2-C-methyl-D-erythritol kinase
LLKNFPNDLTKPAESISSSITQILSELKNQQAEIAKMSGSGATCFAIFSSQNKLDEAQKNLRTIFPDYFIKQAKILSCLKR